MLTYEKIEANKRNLEHLKEKRENLDQQIRNLELKIENQTRAWLIAQSRQSTSEQVESTQESEIETEE